MYVYCYIKLIFINILVFKCLLIIFLFDVGAAQQQIHVCITDCLHMHLFRFEILKLDAFRIFIEQFQNLNQ